MPLYALGDRRPRIGSPVFIAPDAQIIGDVAIGAESGVWFGAVLRGDTEPIRIGARTSIQEHVTIHTDPGFPATVGENCTVGHGAIVHGCTIGDFTLVGMAATVLNGSRIGNYCLIGAGALVTERKEFPDGSLIVGSPARVVRQLDGAGLDRLRASAQTYVDRVHAYLTGFREV